MNVRAHHFALPGIVLLLWLVTLAANAPGQLSFDSVVQLMEGRSGNYAGAHPPLMSALLGAFDHVLPGTALYLVFASALFYLPLIALLNTARPRRPWHWLCAVGLVALLASPLMLIYQGTVWKDVLFANLSVTCFACLAFSARQGRSRLSLLAALAGAVLAAALAAGIRQNGLVVPLTAAIALVIQIRQTGQRTSTALRRGLAFLLLAVGVQLGAQHLVQATAARPIPGSLGWGLPVIHRFDVVGMVAHGAAVPARDSIPPEDAHRIGEAAARGYHPSRVEAMDSDAEMRAFLRNLHKPMLMQLWWDMLRAEPLAWLRHRAAVFRWVVLPPDVRLCLPVHLGVEGPPAAVGALGLAVGVRPQDQALYRYAAAAFGTPLFLNLTWIAFAAILLGILLRRRCRVPGDAAMAALLGAAIGFAGSFALIGIACDVRYLFLVPTAVCAALAHVSRGPEPAEMADAPR
ncbi:hypothetical protein [Neoroseomonas soli]|uniref:Uncharacterized protein n=1 Tax=Neoroseomonas soli TaxID=1081025 RepID=A0A9X9X351_9PROT|nr:hypothetical protein [Neoroseomonas soli]MBR0673830.1 hypothetical protein [Neoroseomonas soli]